MDDLAQLLSQGIEQLRGRAEGPLHFRLIVMPTTVSLLALRAGLRDAREGRPAFLWAILTNKAERGPLGRSAVRDLARVFCFALVLDTVYQLTYLRQFHVVQLLIVAIGCSVVPYTLVRGPVTRLARALRGSRAARSRASEACSAAEPEKGE